MLWERRAEDIAGDYTFAGQVFVTQGVLNRLASDELEAIIQDLRRALIQHGKLDYLQVYVHRETGEKIWWIDNLSDTRRNSGVLSSDQLRDYDYSTLLLPDEY